MGNVSLGKFLMYDQEDIKRFSQINRAAWEEVTPKHRTSKHKQLSADKLAEPETLLLDKVLKSALAKIDLAGRDVVHFCCNDGEELISIKKMGAGRCVGIDICDAAIIAAQELADHLKLDCEFLQKDVYELPSYFDGMADIALVTVGGLVWLPDLQIFFEIVSRSLKPNGVFIICEVHPFLNVFGENWQIDPDSPYFNPGPDRGVGDLDYFGRQPYGNCESVAFLHTMSTIINSLVANGLQIECLDEFPHDTSYFLDNDEVNEFGLPMSCTIIARKVI